MKIISLIYAFAFVFGLSAAELFEAVALVDHHDFSGIRDPRRVGAMLFDTETAEGCEAILDHVLLTGAGTVLWRPVSGAVPRFQSREERYPWIQSPLDKRRLPENRPVQGWMRYYEAEPDIIRHITAAIKGRGLRAGLHWPFEETHWMSWTFGAWNFEHPQYWGVTAQGQVWAGRSSLAYPEVIAHKLRLVDELLERGADHLFIDTWRTGGWGPRFEYVRPEIDRWRERYGSEPPADASDALWCAFVAETTHEWFASLRERLDSSGRKVRLMLGVQPLGPITDQADDVLLRSGVDWRRLVDEGLIDTLVVMGVSWDKRRPFESTREHYREIIGHCNGRCEVLFPVQAYDFTSLGIPSYRKVTKLDDAQIAEKLVQIAWEEGSDGIVMEVVDYDNYKAPTREALRRLLDGGCRFKRGKRPNASR